MKDAQADVVLVTGFGSFPGVPDNPTAHLARAVHGLVVGDCRIEGHVLPVSFARGPQAAIELAQRHQVRLVVGLGVAVARNQVCVERVGVRVQHDRVDVDGATACGLVGPDRVAATLDTERLAQALGAELSDDAGRYVCNAWLYRVAQTLPVPVGFVHVPPAGLAPQRLLDGIRALL